jgi:hypothetical protein
LHGIGFGRGTAYRNDLEGFSVPRPVSKPPLNLVNYSGVRETCKDIFEVDMKKKRFPDS